MGKITGVVGKKKNEERKSSSAKTPEQALGRAIEKKMPKVEPKSVCGGYRIPSDTSKKGEWNDMDYHYGP